MCWNFDFGLKEFDRPNTNIFDKQMFETCDPVSPNVRLCYRVLKFIRDYFFSCRVKTATNELTLREVSYTKSNFSSYLLKQVLFQEVIEFPLCRYWKNGCIFSIIVSTLRKLSNVLSIIGIFDKTRIWPEDGKADVFLPLLENIIKSLDNGCEMLSHQRTNMQSDCRERLVILLGSNLAVNLPKSLVGGLTDDLLDLFHVVFFKSIPPMVLKNLISGVLYEAFCNIVESMDYIDLTGFSASDAGKIIFLLHFFVIIRKEMGTSNFSLKLNSLKEMIESYDVILRTACEKLSGRCYVERIIFIRLEEIFSAMTLEERGFTYDCVDALQICWDGFYRYMASEAMKQLLDKVLHILKSSMNSFKDVEKL